MTDTITSLDRGTDLQVTITEDGAVVDVSTATALAIILTAPSGTQYTLAASVISTGADGQIHATFILADLDPVIEDGTWTYIGRVTFSADQVFHSIDPKEFKVVKI